MTNKTDVEAGNVLRVGELSKYLKMSASFVYKNLDKIPHKRIGSEIRFYKPSIDRWLEHHPIEQAPDKASVARKFVDRIVKESRKSKGVLVTG